MSRTASSVVVDGRMVAAHLPGWDYGDAYQIPTEDRLPDSALIAARRLLPTSTGALRLLHLRDLLVRVAALKPAVTGETDLLPVLHAEAGLAVVGFDDRTSTSAFFVELTSGHVRCTTAVRRHNTLGRVYFAVVGVFHRRWVPYLLRQATKRGWVPPPDALNCTRSVAPPRHSAHI